jgi:hypothetical protein
MAVKHAIESAKADCIGPVLTFLAIPALAETQHPMGLAHANFTMP